MIDLKRVLAENATLPRDQEGQIKSPRYVPQGSAYLSEWRHWLRQHPEPTWPRWLKDDVNVMRIGKKRGE